jgi:hypothetical protein
MPALSRTRDMTFAVDVLIAGGVHGEAALPSTD